MGLTRRKDSFYVEFHVFDDGKHLHLAPPGAGKLKRWKVGSRNQRSAKDQEAMVRTKLLKGQMLSPSAERAQAVTFRDWAETYLSLEEVRKLTTYADRKLKVGHLVEYFGDRLLLSIVPEDVAAYRAQRVCYPLLACAGCHKVFGKAVCPGCGWTRLDSPGPASIQTVNHDHTALTHMFNIAKSLRFKLVLDNPASHILKPDPKNERAVSFRIDVACASAREATVRPAH